MITRNYIKMCEEAEEIQKIWKPKVGDWQFWSNNKTQCASVSIIGSLLKKYANETHRVWLPTQEQLQEIWLEEYNNRVGSLAFKNGWIGIFFNWVKSLSDFTLTNFNELWLAFVMKEKHNKFWNGEGWNNV